MMTAYHSKEGGKLFKYLSFRRNTVKIESTYFTYSREAIYHLMQKNNILSTDNILMPQYQCNSVIDQITPFCKNITFYKIDDQLKFDKEEILNKIDVNTKMIFIVHYFGIILDIDDDFISQLKQKNITIVHDMAHSFLSLYKRDFNYATKEEYIISSIYKNIPLGVGAIAIGDLEVSSGVSYKEFFSVNAKKILTEIRCLVGKRAFTYYNLLDKGTVEEDIVSYANSKHFFKVYLSILKHLNIDKMISDKRKISEDYFEVFNKESIFKNIVTKEILNANVLQAFPIYCDNQDKREKLFTHLKAKCIDIYPWPSYHPLNSFDDLKDKILLLPLDTFSLRECKNYLKVTSND